MRLAAVFSALLFAGCNADSASPHLARGNVLVNNGKRDEAVSEYREAARLAPRHAQPRERLGDTLYDLGRKDEALAAYRDAAAVDPGSATARIGAARVLADKGDLPAARAELTTALEKAPSNLFLLLSRGNLAARAGDRKAALADYERAVHLKSDNEPALYQYGLALLGDGQIDEAAATFDRLLKVAPKSPEGYYGRARVFAARDDGAHAAEALKTAAALVEPDARARLAEQGIKEESAIRDAIRRSLAAMRNDPAFARWSNTAAWPMLSDAGPR
jgi:tetratricopeptide (TPR) repeat protein